MKHLGSNCTCAVYCIYYSVPSFRTREVFSNTSISFSAFQALVISGGMVQRTIVLLVDVVFGCICIL